MGSEQGASVLRPYKDKNKDKTKQSAGLAIWVLLGLVGAGIEDGERAVGVCGELEIVASVWPLQIGNKSRRGIVDGGFFRIMQLPNVFGFGRRFHDSES